MRDVLSQRVAKKYASYFSVGDVVLFGKWKNKRARVVRLFVDDHGNPAIELEPIPKGRKKNKVMSLFKIWRLPEERESTVKKESMDSLTPRVMNAFHKKKALGRGETFENEHYRIHRYADFIKVVDLTFAGKRGKKVDKLSIGGLTSDKAPMESMAMEFVLLAKRGVNWARMKEAAEEQVEAMGGTVAVSYDQERGVDVTPGGFKELVVKGKYVQIEVEYKSFTVRDLVDTNNLPTCIPAAKGGLSAIPVFYRWLTDNEDKAKNMKFQEVLEVMKGLGVPYHYYCAMD